MTEAEWRLGAWDHWAEHGTFKGYKDWTDPSDGAVYTIRKNSNFNPDRKTGIKKADKVKKAGYLAKRMALVKQNTLTLKDFQEAVDRQIRRRVNQGFSETDLTVPKDLAQKSYKEYKQSLDQHLRDIRASIVEDYKGTAGHLLDPADPRSLEIIENYIPEPGGGPGGNYASQNKRIASDEALEVLGIPLDTKGKPVQKVTAAERFMFGGQSTGNPLDGAERLRILRGDDPVDVVQDSKNRLNLISPRDNYDPGAPQLANRGGSVSFRNKALKGLGALGLVGGVIGAGEAFAAGDNQEGVARLAETAVGEVPVIGDVVQSEPTAGADMSYPARAAQMKAEADAAEKRASDAVAAGPSREFCLKGGNLCFKAPELGLSEWLTGTYGRQEERAALNGSKSS